MRKMSLTIISIVILISVFATVAFAGGSIKLFVNGKEIKPDAAPQVINDRVMVPVRWVAEALGAGVQWDAKNQKVFIQSSLPQQIELLQDAIAPGTAKEAAELWAKGVKERNGALQYAVLAPELKKEQYASFESCNWVTGVSSPWIEDYKIFNESETEDRGRVYEIEFTLKASTGPAGTTLSKILVKQYEQNWFITQISNQ